ncbi:MULTISPECIES: thermonuclease family protein [unclassified Campylobacter]|uniref:thermonuclease family protein n=1 Tax=unclassified Campylobacter TaxID=2593542 RepID=UPI001EE45815|nr:MULTISPECIES: thermonuclease family protein [unclassified Campylobacter]
MKINQILRLMNKTPKQLFLVLILGIVSAYTLSLNQQKAQESVIQGIVIKVIDGDTIDVLDLNQTKHRIRLYGIDAPEKKQSYGNKAREFLASLIAGKEVKVLIKDKDKYQRNIGLILLDGMDINKEMVKNGYAWAYIEYSKDYATEEVDAKTFKLGLWADKNSIKPSEFRKIHR